MHYIAVVLIFIVSQIFAVHEVVTFTHSQTDFTQEQLDKAAELIANTDKEIVLAVDAENVFKRNCSSCHGRKGGLGLAGAANLKKSEYSLDERVAMVYYGRTTMQAYKDVLKDEEIIAVSNYLETLRK